MACCTRHVSPWLRGRGVAFGRELPSWQPAPGVRGFIRHPVKAQGHIMGHKMEVIQGSRKRPSYMPPKFPKHPLQDIETNMNEVVTYGDLKLRWQWTTRFSTSRMTVARHWKPQRTEFPRNKPTCAFVWHKDMPHRTPQAELPEVEHFARIKKQELFCVFKSSVFHQHKVHVGDIVQAEKLHRRQAGEKVVFGTVLLAGSKEFTILGKPTVPYAKVHATIEQQTLTRESLVFWYKPRRKQSHFYRRRQYVTMLRIDDIVLSPEEDSADPPLPKPVRLLDLWANRWLDPAEKEGIEMTQGEDGALIPKTALIYDGSEHQPGSYHRRGLTSCYRYWPDPAATHWRL
ncbi:unnamed protein product [Effrenium voratum]|uniref:Large ribosomal subunit protein bL21m n=1 Tax=Effrenium voratum TaxID=2562239 RepID=A0AA36JNJ5_9DINO|nr:unnamed protein product [Effrenium voratum]CAJ1446039.1 unnamed protein product [Effrenium voratum]